MAMSSSSSSSKACAPAAAARGSAVPTLARCMRSRPFAAGGRNCVAARADVKEAAVTGLVFESAKSELQKLDAATTASESLARVNYHPECESAVNEQINVEYNVSYVYHALYCYFGRDNVGLPGFAKFFKAASDEERDHAGLLMDFQNKRGGRVQLKSIVMPEMEFSHAEKGDALYGMELALSLEKLNFQKLRELHEVADKHGDATMADFIEGDLLGDQVDSVNSAAVMVSQLRRIGKGLGVFEFDKTLQ